MLRVASLAVSFGYPFHDLRVPGCFAQLHCTVPSYPAALHQVSENGFQNGQGLQTRAAWVSGLGWILPPLSNSWINTIIWLYLALNRTPNIDCYWVGGSTQGLGFYGFGFSSGLGEGKDESPPMTDCKWGSSYIAFIALGRRMKLLSIIR